MSAHFLISAIKEAWRETIAQRLRIEELLQKVQQLETENAELRVELQEQCALNGTGSEREYVLRGKVDRLERENAALLKEIAPLRETVGVRGDAVTSRDDIDYWSKLVDRADKAVRLETENAALRSLLRESLDCIDQYDYEEAFDVVQRIKTALGKAKPDA